MPISSNTPIIGGLLGSLVGPTASAFRLLRILYPYQVHGLSKIRVGNPRGDGGYVMMDRLKRTARAISLGIGGDVSWDFEMAEMGIEVFQYDHTVSGPPVSHPRFNFRRVGVAKHDSRDGLYRSLESIVATDGRISGELVLKMDVEGAEWDILRGVSNKTLARFSQILVEIHNPLSGPASLRLSKFRLLKKLATNHVPVHVHANNCDYVECVGGILVPRVLEVTYLKRTAERYTRMPLPFTPGFDAPNCPSPEIDITQIFAQVLP